MENQLAKNMANFMESARWFMQKGVSEVYGS